RQLEDAERRRVGAVLPRWDDGGVVAERRWRAPVELPDAALRGDVVVPLGCAVRVDLLLLRIPVRQRDVRIVLEMLRLQGERAGTDPARRPFPERVEDARPRAVLAIDRRDGA